MIEAGKKHTLFIRHAYNIGITNSHGIQTKRNLPELQADIINIPFCIYMSLNGCIYI